VIVNTADLIPTGILRASINLGNPVLAQGTSDAPAGVTVDLAREVADRLGVGVQFLCFDAARKSFEALNRGNADIGFLAIEPAREAQVSFTAPYAIIEGVYAVPVDSPIKTVADVDQGGVRIGVKEGSAYDLFLTRTLKNAEIVRGSDGTEIFEQERLDAVAGVRQPLAGYVASHPGLRLIEPRFMEIRQAVAVPKGRDIAFLRDLVETLKADGFVADSLTRSGQDATVAPPA
jgi:polar amino acid transport system substrate-binding protein